ncbi:MAG TPA: ATP-binding protein [Acidimicrobiales bacterium]|nr:ATP-binding protein [Acidimicrobiales bacterium]
MAEIRDPASTVQGRANLVPPERGTAVGVLSPIGWRLARVIALVSLIALGLLAGVTLVFASADVSTLARQQEDDLAHAVASALAVSYRASGSWSNADLSAPLTLATRAGIAVRVTDASSGLVASAIPEGSRPDSRGRPRSLPILVEGHRVGSVTVQVGATGIGAVGSHLRGTLAAAVAGSAAVVALLAVFAGFVAARRITRPVVSLTRAARAMAAGERGTRVGDIEAPGELAELSSAFDHMADTLEHEDHLRRVLVADIAHELRTPLAILQASTEALVDGVSEPNVQTLSSLHDETIRLSRIVEDLEVLAAAEAAGLSMDHRPVDLARVAAGAADAMEARVDSAGLVLVRSLEPVVMRGDKARLHQVVTNLLTNAVKFTPAGGRISLTVEAADRHARLVVADTGVGIPSDELPYVFDRFWRGRAARQVEGSGVGLAVVVELVHAHGGEVSVTSQDEQGAHFVVTFPRS